MPYDDRPAPVGDDQRHEDPHGGRLARTVGSQETEDPTDGDLAVEVVERGHRPETLQEALGTDRDFRMTLLRGAARPPPRRPVPPQGSAITGSGIVSRQATDGIVSGRARNSATMPSTQSSTVMSPWARCGATTTCERGSVRAASSP